MNGTGEVQKPKPEKPENPEIRRPEVQELKTLEEAGIQNPKIRGARAALVLTFLLTKFQAFVRILLLLTSSAYPEWQRGQARRSHSNLVQVPRC